MWARYSAAARAFAAEDSSARVKVFLSRLEYFQHYVSVCVIHNSFILSPKSLIKKATGLLLRDLVSNGSVTTSKGDNPL